jgi:hypothetical protein
MEVHFEKSFARVVHPQTVSPEFTEIDLTKSSLDIDLTFFTFASMGIWFQPTGYTVINEVPCMIFTGIEPLMENPKGSALRKLRKRFKDYDTRAVGIPLAWQVHLTTDSLQVQSGYNNRKIIDELYPKNR